MTARCLSAGRHVHLVGVVGELEIDSVVALFNWSEPKFRAMLYLVSIIEDGDRIVIESAHTVWTFERVA